MNTPNTDTLFAYRCPHCNTITLGKLGPYVLQAKMLKCKCTCGESDTTIVHQDDERFRFEIPCFLCEKKHKFVVASSLLFRKEALTLTCPDTGVSVGFIGGTDEVEAAINNTENELKELSEKLSMSLNGSKKEDEESFLDSTVYDTIRFTIKELEADAEIDCPCHSGRYDFHVVKNGVRIYCPDCNAEYICPTSSETAIHDFLTLSHLELK